MILSPKANTDGTTIEDIVTSDNAAEGFDVNVNDNGTTTNSL